MLPFLTTSVFSFRIFPSQITFFIHINMHSLTFLILLPHSYHVSSPQILCITLMFLGTPSSGLVSQARHGLILYQRNNNTSSSPFLLFPSQTLKPIFSAFSKINTIFFATIAAYGSLLSSLTANPPPFYLGALHRKDRRTSSSAVQLAFDHAFTCTYSQIFRTNASDTLWCPHHGTPPPSTPSSPLSDQVSFERLMAIQHANPRATVSPSPSQASLPRPQQLSPSGQRCSLQPSPRVRYLNSTHHVLFECSHLSSPCRQIFGPFPFDAYVFGMFDGGFKLGEFQRATNSLLRPLPPQPDPP